VKSLAGRISLLSVGVAVITALLAGALSLGLIRTSGDAAAKRSLARLADVTSAAVANPGVAPRRLAVALGGLRVRSGVIRPNGRLATGNPLVRDVVTPGDVATVLAGGSVSAARSSGGSTVFVEARPAGNGAGVVLVQRRVDAVAAEQRALRRIAVALVIAGAFAAALGLLVAWRLARPLRRTASAAHALAAGARDVALRPGGPTEVAEVAEAINALAAALRHSEGRQRDFLLSVSHDLRTPLTAISGYAESLADGVVPPADAARVGAVMLGEARRLERLVGDLLDLARLDARDFRVEPADVDLAALVAAAAEAWVPRCASAGVVFRFEPPPGRVEVVTDASRLRQAVDGLLDNALRITPAGAPIVLAARVAPGEAVVEVRDGGPGLTDADLAVAFERGALYERYRGVRQVGTGLGLAIVAGLVHRLGATIEAGHAAEGGARFTVRLPRPAPISGPATS
jgi:two-component system sensor histidine kinase BaeS